MNSCCHLNFHLIRSKSWPKNDFELTMTDVYIKFVGLEMIYTPHSSWHDKSSAGLAPEMDHRDIFLATKSSVSANHVLYSVADPETSEKGERNMKYRPQHSAAIFYIRSQRTNPNYGLIMHFYTFL